MRRWTIWGIPDITTRQPARNKPQQSRRQWGVVCINHSRRFAHHYCARAPKLPPEPECILYTRLRSRCCRWTSTKTTAALLLSQPWPSLCTRNSCPFRMVGYFIDAADRRTCNLSISINVSEFQHMRNCDSFGCQEIMSLVAIDIFSRPLLYLK